jgi:phosphohistidine phosphatase
MKNLVLIRHSKAEEESNSDFERKLTKEGNNLAEIIAAKLIIKPEQNTKFISSPATRAIETAKIFASYFKYSNENISTSDFLYKYFTVDRFFMFLESEYTNSNNIWIFGHNPMLSEIAYVLSKEKIISMPKCAVISFKITTDKWIDVNKSNSKLEFFENPKQSK